MLEDITPEAVKTLLNQITDQLREEEMSVNHDMQMIEAEAADRKQERWERHQALIRPLYQHRKQILDAAARLVEFSPPVYLVPDEED